MHEATERLLESSPEFKEVYVLYRECGKKVEKLKKKKFLTVNEELEEKRLKKLKLVLKDKIEGIVFEHRGRS